MTRTTLTRDRRARPHARVPAVRGAGAVAPSPSPEEEEHRHGLQGVVSSVGDELRHLRQVEEKGDSPATPVLVVAHVLLALLVVVSIELVVAFAFYFGWL